MDEKTRENNRLRQRRFLELHKDEVNSKRREKYHERINGGKCPRCGGKTKKGRTLCTDCCEYMLDLNRKYARQNKAEPRAKTPAKAKAPVKAKAPAKAKAEPKTKKAAKTAPRKKAQ
ncbi:MAG: hypothetical protein LBG95_07315 [Treponema sp.]|nr:hypothetical protein [Treponema sp.]